MTKKDGTFMGNSPLVSRINGLLAEKGISKQVFYAACGITSASYSNWNTGKTTPRAKNVEVIADYLGTTTEYLLTGLGEKEKAPTEDGERKSDVLDEVDVAFYGDYKQLTDDDKETVRDMVRIMRERRNRK